MTRRGLLTGIVAAAGAAVGAVVGVPALLFTLAPARERRPAAAWHAVGPLDAFDLGGVHPVVVDAPGGEWPAARVPVSVFVWRAGAEDVVVFSRACTDLGCPVNWDSGSEWFFCPCHGGIFDREGTPKAGPPPRPLYRYRTRVRAGVVEIDLNSLPPETASAT